MKKNNSRKLVPATLVPIYVLYYICFIKTTIICLAKTNKFENLPYPLYTCIIYIVITTICNAAFCTNVSLTRVILDSPVRSTLFTLDRQSSNQVSENSCAEAVLRGGVVGVDRSGDQTKMAEWLN